MWELDIEINVIFGWNNTSSSSADRVKALLTWTLPDFIKIYFYFQEYLTSYLEIQGRFKKKKENI